MMPHGTIISDGQIIGAIWLLGRKGVCVLISDTMYSGFCVADALGGTLRGYSDVWVHWNK